MKVFKYILNVLSEPGLIRFFVLVVTMVAGFNLDREFNTLVFLPIAFIIEGLLTFKYKYFLWEALDSWGFPRTDEIIYGKHATYWAIFFTATGLILLIISFTTKIGLNDLLG